MKFRLVDRICAWAPWQRITGIKAVSFEEYSLKECFGDEPRLPEMLLLESFLQLGNWLVLLSSDFQQMGMVARISEVRFHSQVLPGERVRLEVRVARRHEDGFEFGGEGYVQQRLAITGFGCVAAGVPLAQYQDEGDLRVLFSELYSPSSSELPVSPANKAGAAAS